MDYQNMKKSAPGIRKLTGLFVCVFTLLIVLTGCNDTYFGDITPPPPDDASAIIAPKPLRTAYPIFSPNPEKGAIVYDQWCTRCHGNSGLGN
jgi:hypothetical protein